jgi:hypothetical protein
MTLRVLFLAPLCLSGVDVRFVVYLFSSGELTWPALVSISGGACAVYPLFGGGVAEWLKAAVC